MQGTITIQEVDSVDGRFILNFSVESDKRFVLKAQPWHYKRDGVIFASFDGRGDPADVMAIWAQVRGLPFELKTEAMGRTLGEQIGEVLAVSHRNKMIVDKYLRVRVEIFLHEPLRSTVSFTPLGSSKELEFQVRYEKLPQYCECCGLVGHNSERFCRIPKENRKPMYSSNLHVDAYWKEQGSSQRSPIFGGLPPSEEIPSGGTGRRNLSKALEGAVVEVASAVRDLVVADKAATAPGNMAGSTPAAHGVSAGDGAAAGATHLGIMPGQEGRVGGPASLALVPSRPGQEGQDALHASAEGSYDCLPRPGGPGCGDQRHGGSWPGGPGRAGRLGRCSSDCLPRPGGPGCGDPLVGKQVNRSWLGGPGCSLAGSPCSD